MAGMRDPGQSGCWLKTSGESGRRKHYINTWFNVNTLYYKLQMKYGYKPLNPKP